MRQCFICESEGRCSHREEGLWKFYADFTEAADIQCVVATEVTGVLPARKPVAVQERAEPLHQAATGGARLTAADAYASNGVFLDASADARRRLYRR
jgi:hypothetical protein